jgi:uncharacterized protein (DUF3820 family)
MKQAIGFANKFYTLWSIDTQPVYTTDVYGKHWLTSYNTHYTYHKNISFELEKAKALYPLLEVCEDLKGKSESWVSSNTNNEDLCPQIMKFGKYCGKDINELLEQDFQYLIWIYENKGYSSNGQYVKELPKIQEHFKVIEDNYNKLINDRNNAFKAVLDAGFYEFIAERNLSVDTVSGFAYLRVPIIDTDLMINFKFEQGMYHENYYNGFTYGLPIINGKAKRMKGKYVKFEIIEDTTEVYQVIVKNVTINK